MRDEWGCCLAAAWPLRPRYAAACPGGFALGRDVAFTRAGRAGPGLFMGADVAGLGLATPPSLVRAIKAIVQVCGHLSFV